MGALCSRPLETFLVCDEASELVLAFHLRSGPLKMWLSGVPSLWRGTCKWITGPVADPSLLRLLMLREEITDFWIQKVG